MTLNDLETGMIVTMRDGHECVVLKNAVANALNYRNVFVDANTNAFFDMNSYTSDFKCKFSFNGEHDIVKIEQPNHYYGCIDMNRDRDKRTVLWREERRKKLTVAEIEARLDYKVEIVSEEE